MAARNPFGLPIQEDAEAELAGLVGKHAPHIMESLDARLPVVEDVGEEPEPLDERQMEQGVRFELVNVNPGDFGGDAKHEGERAIRVMGNTFPIKDELKKLGLRFNSRTKTWEMIHQFNPWGGRMRGSFATRDQVKKAIPKVEALVKSHNAAVEKNNRSALAGVGVKGDKQPTTPKAEVKNIMSMMRLNKRLVKNGIGIVWEVPAARSMAGFYKAGAPTVWVIGDTFKVKDELKRFGFRFSRQLPPNAERVAREQAKGLGRVGAGWSMDGATYDRISKQVKQTLLRASEGTLGESDELAEGDKRSGPLTDKRKAFTLLTKLGLDKAAAQKVVGDWESGWGVINIDDPKISKRAVDALIKLTA